MGVSKTKLSFLKHLRSCFRSLHREPRELFQVSLQRQTLARKAQDGGCEAPTPSHLRQVADLRVRLVASAPDCQHPHPEPARALPGGEEADAGLRLFGVPSAPAGWGSRRQDS